MTRLDWTLAFDYGFYLTVALTSAALALTWLSKRASNLPPGPRGWPVVGYLPFLGKEAYVTLHRLRDKYGPIYSLYLGPKLVVVLDSIEVVKEALSNNDILARPAHPPNHLLPDSTNMSVSSGHIWKEQRQFAVQTLRQFGMGKSLMEELIQEELQRLTQTIDREGGHPMNLDSVLLSSVSNNITALVFGRKMAYGDKDRKFLDDMLRTMTLYFRPTRIHAYFPWLRKWMAMFSIWGYEQVEKYMTKLGTFIDTQIAEHSQTLDRDSARDFIDHYLLAMQKQSSGTSFSMKMLKGNIQSLLGAGSTPARATVEWALVSMVIYPDIQRKVHQELDSVVGRDRLPSWSDRNSLPYTMAVISEVMRQYTIIPISMLRCTSKRCTIGGYDIPEGAIVMTNIWGVHHDPAHWTEPYAFKPERFLHDEKGARPEAFIPYSYGKRNCLGEDMANMVVFLYFTTLLQRYTLSTPLKSGKFQEVLGIAKLVILDNISLTVRN